MTLDAVNAGIREMCEREYPGRRPVFGEGKAGCTVMLIGEAPGGQEEAQGRPFVGKAGKNLDEFLAMADIPREDVYITNVVKIRPIRISKTGTISNRAPASAETGDFLPWLLEEIRAVDPSVVVTLGNTPLKALLGNGQTIGAVHGKTQSLEGRRLYPLYHPASVIYDRSLRDVYAADVRSLGEVLREWNVL